MKIFRFVVFAVTLLSVCGFGGTQRIYVWGDNRSGAFIHSTSASTQAISPLSGSLPFISIMCKFQGVADESRGLKYFQRMYSNVYPGLDHYWRELSYGNSDLSDSRAIGWLDLPHNIGYYLATSDYLYYIAKDCTTAADSLIDFNDYAGVNLMLNADIDGNSYGGENYIKLDGTAKSWRMTWLPPWAWQNIVVVEHEMGHAFGLAHSTASGYEYGNRYDVMSDMWTDCERAESNIYGCIGQSIIAQDKSMLGWMDSKEIFVTRKRSIITIDALELQHGNNFQMVRIPIGGSSMHHYTVEVRGGTGYDEKLPGIVLVVHEVSDNTPAKFIKALSHGEFAKKGIAVRVISSTATSYTILVIK